MGRILLHLPHMETQHLWVRELVPSDVHDFAAYMLDPSYQRHLAVRPKSVEDVRGMVLRAIARQDRDMRRSYHLAGWSKAVGASIADGFILHDGAESAELGWGVHPALWGGGIGTEMARALVAAAFERLGVKRVWCKVMAGNIASQRLAARMGFTARERISDYPLGAGRAGPVVIFSLGNSEYYESAY
jgi:RimJ/RimL family protein N-acetyltransferase